MSRRYQLPGAQDAVLAALAARLDTVEHTQRDHAKDLAALGRGLTTLTSQLRATSLPDLHPDLPAVDDATGGAEAAGKGGPSAGNRPDTGKPVTDSSGQPDWLPLTDTDQALDLLTNAQEWIDRIGIRCGLGLPACWPLHPAVVTEVLALSAERTAAYESPSTTAVSEYLHRWLPGARDRIRKALQNCLGGHQHQRTTYHVTALDLAAVATWWTRDRATPAPAALRLRPMDQR
jgi:hypothetical protein